MPIYRWFFRLAPLKIPISSSAKEWWTFTAKAVRRTSPPPEPFITETQSSQRVTEQPTDILPLERTGAFNGVYHALGGKLSPLNHVGPEDLRFEALLQRIKQAPPSELILALGADVEGEATASYLSQLLDGIELRVTRLAQGLPPGLGLESADDVTIARAFSGRTEVRRS